MFFNRACKGCEARQNQIDDLIREREQYKALLHRITHITPPEMNRVVKSMPLGGHETVGQRRNRLEREHRVASNEVRGKGFEEEIAKHEKELGLNVASSKS